ncbi:Disease resistance protein RGA2 [Rhynchospora pubera]|uniref:Disease resistance protein RGA2 n=1 Tax=Rhynchospora pubera TaxID=906938 RepID=A0AAV8GNS8_9POAL|nr:Disease resistance protein RGA2 [Rhynchospora pubera]
MAIAESLALVGLRMIASPVMNKLVDKGFAYVGMDVPRDLKDLVDIYLPQIVIATRASEETDIDMPQLKSWLQRLKDTYEEAEDILDEVEYQTIAESIKQEKRAFTVRITSLPLIKPLAEYTDKKGKKLSFLSSNKRKLWFQLNKLKKDVKGLIPVAKLLYAVRTQPTETPIGETSSVPKSTIFVGHDGEHRLIVDDLLKEPVPTKNKSYSVVAIVGIGGAGKTTLAQHVYHDHDVTKHFDVKMWVSLTRKMDLIKHTKAMIESATSGKKCPQSSTLDALQSILVEILSQSKRALLVLDDLWYIKSVEEDLLCNRNDENEDWDSLLAPLNSTQGVILLTSRSKKLPTVLESETKLLNLRELTKDDSMKLFRFYAGLDKMDKSPVKNELEEISVDIVKNLSGLPLAIKSVAFQLCRTRDVSKWREIQEMDDLNEPKTALMWSYQQLDKALQRCFLFCSVFPKGSMFTKEGLPLKWLASNCIRSDNKNVESIGAKYFDELVSLFFFQPVFLSGYFVVHDVFHDLAESLTREEIFRIEDEQAVEIPLTVHHLSIAVQNIEHHVPSICKLEKLRTLIFLQTLQDSKINLDKIFKKLKKLRILVLNLSPGITQLPKTVCNLKYLKFLDFFRSSINQVPESLSSLHLLCILDLPFTLPVLPKSMSNLRNLRYVSVTDKTGHSRPRIPLWRDVGKVTSLRTLPEFHVTKEKGYELQQLRNLRELKGFLKISGLENVSHKDEAAEVKLKDKNLNSLTFEWNSDSNGRNSDFETIKCLQPPKLLSSLSIIGYSADRYPTWLGDESIRHVRRLWLGGCKFLDVLPSNLYMWKYCEEIILYQLLSLKELPAFPLCLKKLIILTCPFLVFISEEALIMSNKEVQLNHHLLLEEGFVLSKVAEMLEAARKWSDEIIGYYQRLMHFEFEMLHQISKKLAEKDLTKELQILAGAQGNTLPLYDQLQAWWNCHQERVKFINSRVLEAKQFDLPSSLTSLRLGHCNITDKALSDCLRNLCSLQNLQLEALMSLVTLPLELTMLQLSRLRILIIRSCWLLKSLGALHKLYLEKLDVNCCPCLEFETENGGSALTSSLQWLKIGWCTISSGILRGEFPKLNYIEFEGCQSSSSLPVEKLASVEYLILLYCADICSLSGLHLLRNLKTLRLKLVPNLQVQDLLQSFPNCMHELQTDNLEILKIYSSETFIPPRHLVLEHLQQETLSSEDLSLLHSIEGLCFFCCKIKSVPTNFATLSSLQKIQFIDCPNISQLPELPKSVQWIKIKGCPALKERSQKNGEDWPKIADIKYKAIE